MIWPEGILITAEHYSPEEFNRHNGAVVSVWRNEQTRYVIVGLTVDRFRRKRLREYLQQLTADEIDLFSAINLCNLILGENLHTATRLKDKRIAWDKVIGRLKLLHGNLERLL